MFTGCLWPWREGLETQKKIQKSKKHFKDILIWLGLGMQVSGRLQFFILLNSLE